MDVGDQDQVLRERAALLEKTFTDFGLKVRVVGINTGPVVTQFELALETGLRLHKVTALADDIALNLRAPSVRMVAPIPGKNTVGVEIPNEHRTVVRLKEVILASAKKIAKSKIPLFLGKDSEGRPLVHDLAEMPHLLIAGATGTGKSVCMNAIILSMLMTRRPDELKMIMIDPKVVELSQFGAVPHLMHPVINDMKKAEAVLAWAVDKMEERYDLLARARVRNIASYNELKYDEIVRRLKPADEAERGRHPGPDAVHRHLPGRDGRPHHDDAQGGRRPHHPPDAEVARGRHPSGAGDADGRRWTSSPASSNRICRRASASRCPARSTAAWCSTKWAPTSCSARATCCSSSPARAA